MGIFSPSLFTVGDKNLDVNQIEGWVGPTVSLDVMEKWNLVFAGTKYHFPCCIVYSLCPTLCEVPLLQDTE